MTVPVYLLISIALFLTHLPTQWYQCTKLHSNPVINVSITYIILTLIT